jgi:hypothetical protein
MSTGATIGLIAILVLAGVLQGDGALCDLRALP